MREQVKAKGEITLDEMAARLRTDRGVFVDPSSVWRLFQRLGLTHKKTFKRLSKSVPRLPAKGMSGSRIASPLWRICWTASGFWTGLSQHGQDVTVLGTARDLAARRSCSLRPLAHSDRINWLDAPWVIDGTMNRANSTGLLRPKSDLPPT